MLVSNYSKGVPTLEAHLGLWNEVVGPKFGGWDGHVDQGLMADISRTDLRLETSAK